MRKVALKVFTFAAAAVAPHLIAINTNSVQVRKIEKLGPEERIAMKNLTEKAVFNPEATSIKS